MTEFNAAMDYSKVAHLYDAYVTTDIDLPFFLKETKGCGTVLELMAGTGRVSLPLLEVGINLTCVDNSRDMLTILREKLKQKGLSAIVHEMDVCELTLPGQYDLIILPFHSFSEIVGPEDQRKALTGIRNHLMKTGRFICTLHNPPVRLKSVTGVKKVYGEYPLPDNTGKLMLSAMETYNTDKHIVTGTQFYEIFDHNGVIRSKSSVDIQFYLHSKEEFEVLVRSEGFTVIDLYGDYSYHHFDPATSPFMIWLLGQ